MAIVRRHGSSFDMPELWRRFFGQSLDLEGWVKVEEFQDGNTLIVRAELPDINPDEDVELTVVDGALNIQAQRKEHSEQREKHSYRSEFHYGAFARTITLPAAVKEDDIKAFYKDGILEIRVPIATETKSTATKVPVTRG